MRKIGDVLRLKYGFGRSHREIATILRISHSTVGSYVRRAREAGVSWPLPDDLDDAALEAALYPPTPPSRVPRPGPDWARVHRELARHKRVTLQLLWLEYREAHPDGYGYSRFCDRYREWRGRLNVVLRHVYRAGEKAFVDYAGPTVEVTDRRTGEIREAKVFVGVLAASNHTFVDITLTRSLPDWTASHVRMFEHWGGVPELVIPDNEKAAVRRASRYEPDVNRTYHDLAAHYGTAVLPARPRSPQDKAKVEVAVQNVGRWVLAPLRNHRFFSLSEVREAVKPLLAALNERPFQKAKGSRRSLFEDRLSLLPEREKTERAQRRYLRLKGLAKLHLDATIEDLNFKAARGLDRSLVLRLASGQWIKDGQTVLVSGATGSGKSYLACALGHQACQLGISTRYFRVSRLLDQLALARADGSYLKLVQRLAKTWLLVLDDWGLASLSGQGRHDLLEVLDDRYARRGTVLASQLPVEHWHDAVGDPTFGDAILDRLLNNAHRITLKGGSMRRLYDSTKEIPTTPSHT
ncbi:MAG: IS21 family transposase [Gemmatimonadota bacterium]|nr:IS21 family transposase [Gemmatimonadota bacterium]